MKRAVTSLLVLLVVVGAACADPAPSGDGATDAAAPVPPPQSAFTIADQGVTNVPTEIQAGINELTVTNEGEDKHFPAIARINDGVKKQEVALALVDQDFETFFTSSMVGGAFLEAGKLNLAPGKSATLTTELTEGTYILADPDSKRFEPGYFEVGPAGDEEVATPDAEFEIVESEYAIEMPAEIPAGSHSYSLTNAGEQPHELIISEKGNEESEAAYALAPLAGSTSWVTFDLPPGKYIVACYFPDLSGGKMGRKSHFDLGMKTKFTVK
ncbi:MAG TPA: hypothetical protein VE174_00215 [Actinomycetota bacterium]|nr:hypothetical protein [Actinomycetota bacterium]